MTQTKTPLADRAARTAERLEAYDRRDDGPIMEHLAATDTGARIDPSGSVRSAWIVIQPTSPRVEFEPFAKSITVSQNGDEFTRSVFDDEAVAAVTAAKESLKIAFDGVEVSL